MAVAPPAFVVDTKRAKPAMSLVNLPTSNLQLNAPQKTILQLLQQQNIPACDLTQALRLGQEKTDMYFTYDGHWTKQVTKSSQKGFHLLISVITLLFFSCQMKR